MLYLQWHLRSSVSVVVSRAVDSLSRRSIAVALYRNALRALGLLALRPFAGGHCTLFFGLLDSARLGLAWTLLTRLGAFWHGSARFGSAARVLVRLHSLLRLCSFCVLESGEPSLFLSLGNRAFYSEVTRTLTFSQCHLFHFCVWLGWAVFLLVSAFDARAAVLGFCLPHG